MWGKKKFSLHDMGVPSAKGIHHDKDYFVNKANMLGQHTVDEMGGGQRKTNLSQEIFDSIGAKPEDLKKAFGRPIDSTGKKVKYGGIGENYSRHEKGF